VSVFIFNSGILAEDTDPETYITDACMKMVAADDELRLFALRENATATGDPTSAATTSTKLMCAIMAGVLILASVSM
jgi:hypothetical protein